MSKLPQTFALVFITLGVLAASASHAQSVHVGADFVSRYVWRGSDFGESFSVQPALTLGHSGLKVGAWGSYSLSSDAAMSNELDLWASYTVTTTSAGSFSVSLAISRATAVTDPNSGTSSGRA